MNTFDMIVNFFKQGGAFLYPIAAVFAVGLGFAAERFIYLHRVAKGNRRLWAELAPLIHAGDFRGAMALAEQTDSALSTVMRYSMSRIATARRRDDIEKAMEDGAARQNGVPFLWVKTLSKPTQVGAKGGNVLLLDGSVPWRNIKAMSNYWAFQSGIYWNSW